MDGLARSTLLFCNCSNDNHSGCADSLTVQAHRYGSLSDNQGRNEGAKEGTIPRAPNYYGAPNHSGRRRTTAVGAEKSQKCHQFFSQNSTFASERP